MNQLLIQLQSGDPLALVTTNNPVYWAKPLLFCFTQLSHLFTISTFVYILHTGVITSLKRLCEPSQSFSSPGVQENIHG